ncbi:MAG: hypothetical protein JW909_01550 [Planctomycetes bacterium]|nr:hypothetical protein [Planctomycetota bacterium]
MTIRRDIGALVDWWSRFRDDPRAELRRLPGALRRFPKALLLWLGGLDRRIIYLLTALALIIPLSCELMYAPPRMAQAEKLFDFIEGMKERDERSLVLVSVDWGPQTRSELEPATLAVIKHCMYSRVPVVVMTLVYAAQGFTVEIPREAIDAVEKARRDAGLPEDEVKVVYGRDWINIGYQLGSVNAVRGIASDLPSQVSTDVNGTPLSDFPIMRDVANADDFGLMVEITGYVGFANMWLQWFKKEKPVYISLACTSVSVPESYAYLDSGQFVGLLEGMPGAAGYDRKLEETLGIPHAEKTYRAMTQQMFGQALVVILVVLGNLAYVVGRRVKEAA